jgi:CheY-like chemotaxis protein
MNLILNAADSIADEPGRVTVSTLVRHIDGQDTRLWMQTGRALEPGEYVVLEVSDTGAGMNRATMARIFDPFFTTKPAGRGLGLAAVLGIVRAHGGGLAVRSEKSQGSTFTVLLPAASDDAVRPEQEPDNLSLSEGIVLVIDDEAPVREAVTEMLEEEGYGVAAAATAREALELFGTWQHAIGLVLLDFSLPGKTGKAIYRELAEIEPSVKVLLSSGYSESEVTKDFPEGALWGFIQKPYQPAALLREVRKAFREQG